MARRANVIAIMATLVVVLTAVAPLVTALPTMRKTGGAPTWQASGGSDQPSYQSYDSGTNKDIYLYFHTTTSSGARYVLNTQGGSTGTDTITSTKPKTFTLQEALTKNLKVWGHEVDTTHKGFWLDLTVIPTVSVTVTVEILDNDKVVGNKTQLVTQPSNRWNIPFVVDGDSYIFMKGDRIIVRISTTGTGGIAANYGSSKLWVLCDPVSLNGDSYNINGAKAKTFQPNAPQDERHVIIRGVIDDAWGASDVQSTHVAIKSPSGSTLINATAKMDGLNYTYDWNYSANEPPGSYNALVSMLDQQNNANNITIDFSMATYGVRLDSPQAQDGVVQGAAEKGGCTDYTVTVLNTGAIGTTYSMTQTSADVGGWALTMSPSSTGTVNPGESKMVTVHVCADDSVEEGTISTFYIQAQATTDPGAKDSLQIITTASPKIDLTIKWVTGTCSNLVNTGGNVSCDFVVANTGLQSLNVSVKMTMEKGSPDWSARVSPSSVLGNYKLQPSQSVAGILSITAPKDPSKPNQTIINIQAEVTDIQPPLTKVITATILMSTGINIEVVGDQSVKINSDGAAEFFILVTNTDPLNEHTITMSTAPPSAWGVTFEASNSVFSLNAQETQTIKLKVTPSSSASAGPYNIEVTGKYQDNPSTWDKVVLQVVINENHQLTLKVAPASIEVGANEDAIFNITITNNGNVNENSATLTVNWKSGDDLKAEYTICNVNKNIKTVSIAIHGTLTCTVKITPSANAKHKDAGTYSITVTGSSGTTSTQQVTVKVMKNTTQLLMETMKDWQMIVLIALTVIVCVFYAVVARR